MSVKQRSGGGLLLLRRKTPLPRRSVVYFCSGAHRRVVTKVRATGATATDEEIEEFYKDNLKLVHILLGIFNAMAYDPEDAAKVFGFYASHFWGAFQKTGNRTR